MLDCVCGCDVFFTDTKHHNMSEELEKVEEVEKILSKIDKHYSKTVQLKLLIFLAQAISPFEQLKQCEGVPEVYREIEKKCSDPGVAAALLLHMLKATRYNRTEELESLSTHCCNEGTSNTIADSLRVYKDLLCLGGKLIKNNTYHIFLEHISENKLNKSKIDLQSPLDMLQSMICAGTIDPNDRNSLEKELIVPLKSAELTDEAQFMEIDGILLLNK